MCHSRKTQFSQNRDLGYKKVIIIIPLWSKITFSLINKGIKFHLCISSCFFITSPKVLFFGLWCTLLGDQSVIGTSSLRHEEHHILALEVGETSLIRVPDKNVPMQTHTCNRELFFWNLAHPHTLLNPTHPTVSQPWLSLTSLCVCVRERERLNTGLGQKESFTLSVLLASYFPLKTEP